MARNKPVLIGKITRGENIRIKNKTGESIVNLGVSKALKAYKEKFKNF